MPSKVLYKYYPEDNPFFSNFAVRFTPRSDLNDPFELRPAMSVLNQAISEGDKFDKSKVTVDNSFVDNLRGLQNTGIFCLCESKLNPLMWSHYANHHRGFVIGIDVSSKKFIDLALYSPQGGVATHPVKYSKKRALQVNHSSEWFTLKYEDWAYEKEHRIITHLYRADIILENGEQVNLEQVNISQLMPLARSKFTCLFILPIEALKSVTFGAKMDEDRKNSILQLIHAHAQANSFGLEHEIVIEQARLCDEDFKVEVQVLDTIRVN